MPTIRSPPRRWRRPSSNPWFAWPTCSKPRTDSADQCRSAALAVDLALPRAARLASTRPVDLAPFHPKSMSGIAQAALAFDLREFLMTELAFTTDRSFTLSDAQRSAIEADLGPMLVLAGPGAGKTFCLIERIRFLIENRGVPPERICAVTFTNKAAEEVATRLGREIGDRAESVTRSTIHSLCVK